MRNTPANSLDAAVAKSAESMASGMEVALELQDEELIGKNAARSRRRPNSEMGHALACGRRSMVVKSQYAVSRGTRRWLVTTWKRSRRN